MIPNTNEHKLTKHTLSLIIIFQQHINLKIYIMERKPNGSHENNSSNNNNKTFLKQIINEGKKKKNNRNSGNLIRWSIPRSFLGRSTKKKKKKKSPFPL